MLVVKIGGCNGSGKTSLVRELLRLHNLQYRMALTQVQNEDGKTYKSKESVYCNTNIIPKLIVLGSYQNVCGGMDTISDKFRVRALVEKFAVPSEGHVVIFEGLITGKTYGYLGELSEKPRQKGRWLYVFLDTPFNVCVERVLARRKEKGNTAPFDPERTMRPTFKGVQSTAKKAGAKGHPVIVLDHRLTPADMAEKLMEEIGAYI